MKIKENVALRQVVDTWVVLPLKEATVDFAGMLTLNESGALLWRKLEGGATREELATALTEEYEVSFDVALADVDECLAVFDKAGCIYMD